MKTKIILTIVLFTICNILNGQNDLLILKTGKSKLSYWIGKEYHKDGWTITPQLNPDVLEVSINEMTIVAFVSESDSLCFGVEPGRTYDFIVLQNGSTKAYTQIKAVKYIPPVIFTDEYVKSHDKGTFVEIPEIYELVNIIFAITQTGKKDNYLVEKGTDYYKDVLKKFDSFKDEKIIKIIDSLIAPRLVYYSELKMDAYSFEFNEDNKIVQSKIYNRTSREQSNTLIPYISLIQDFADKTDFMQFYKGNQTLYQDQINFYKDSVNVEEMHKWLDRNFPGTSCNALKIIFSPLVSGWQSSNIFQDNNFTEVHTHVNYPYYISNKFSYESNIIRRGNTVFTELNHAYIGSERRRFDYNNRITVALKDLSKWIDYSKTAKNYNNPTACFDEYTNWVLVSLWYLDNAPESELNTLITNNEDYMTNSRGFIKFTEFNKFIINLYKNNKQYETIADLYPQIINWFEVN